MGRYFHWVDCLILVMHNSPQSKPSSPGNDERNFSCYYQLILHSIVISNSTIHFSSRNIHISSCHGVLQDHSPLNCVVLDKGQFSWNWVSLCHFVGVLAPGPLKSNSLYKVVLTLYAHSTMGFFHSLWVPSITKVCIGVTLLGG